MKPHPISYAFLSLFLLTLAGCLTTRADLRADQTAGNVTPRAVAEVPRAATPAAVATAAPLQVVAVDTPLAPSPVKPAPPATVATRFEEYDEQLRLITGRLDVLENNSGVANANQVTDAQAKAAEKLKIDEHFAVFEEALKKLQTELETLAADFEKSKGPPALPVPAAPVAAKGRADFDEGEALFMTKRWKEAVVAYQRYRDANPKGAKYAAATLKIGMAFQELGLKDESRAFYDEVTAKFPRGAEAKKATQRLKSLK